MAKKMSLVLVIAGFLTGGGGGVVFAQTWYDSYAPGIDEGKVFINAGVGLGTYTFLGEPGIPPLSVSADFKLPIKLPITIGGIGTFTTRETTPSSSSGSDGEYQIDVTYIDIGLGVRGMWHFNFIKNLDTYAGLTLGWVIQTTDVNYVGDYWDSAPTGTKTSYDGVSYFLFGVNIGARFFFTRNIGIYLELGWSTLQFGSIGLSLKF